MFVIDHDEFWKLDSDGFMNGISASVVIGRKTMLSKLTDIVFAAIGKGF
ncbi:hypothetical protein J7W08_11275 [Methanococcoides orientis]|nr:hypothetical protein [Methanococcoides orientis]UGV40617.1 hypothetical protein J7W08_11275 [Methanococcoides orientis]